MAETINNHQTHCKQQTNNQQQLMAIAFCVVYGVVRFRFVSFLVMLGAFWPFFPVVSTSFEVVVGRSVLMENEHINWTPEILITMTQATLNNNVC